MKFNNARSRYRRQGGRAVMADINVTPMVDVMLVLLVIFMVTAPLLVTGVPVDLPESQAGALKQDNKPIQVSLDARGGVFIDKMALSDAQFAQRLYALREARKDTARIYVRADKTLDYGRVMKIVGDVNAAGFTQVALVSEFSAPQGRKAPILQ